MTVQPKTREKIVQVAAIPSLEKLVWITPTTIRHPKLHSLAVTNSGLDIMLMLKPVVRSAISLNTTSE